MKATLSQPLISIVTPSLNQAAFLGEALTSVRDQDYPAHEHLVLDGGSSDGTQDLLQRFASPWQAERLFWRSHSDGGQSAALNEGFGRAQGEIIGWLNADDRYRPGCFARVAEMFAQHPGVDVVYGDYTFIDPRGEHLALRREIEFNHFVLKYCHTLYIPTTATFFRRRVFDAGHRLCADLHYAMDLEFFLRLAAAGFRFRHMPQLLADFRIHAAGKSTRFVAQQRAEHRSVVLRATPLARRFRSARTRNFAATLLRVPADALRYTEKLARGFYLPESLRLSARVKKAQERQER